MRVIPAFLRVVAGPLLSAVVIFSAATGASAQQSGAQQKPTVLKPDASDKTAAEQSKLVFRKVWVGHKAPVLPQSKLVVRAENKQGDSSEGSQDSQNAIRYPGDLDFHGGVTVEMLQSHNIYLLPGGSCSSASCWGDPEGFLRALGKSEFMHVTDQYVGEHASDRYTLGQNFSVFQAISTTPLTDADVQAIVHAAAAGPEGGGTGYGHIYHVFLPPGQDECIVPGVCASNVFCAYHGSVDFSDGHLLYSVEPFADVPGCTVRPGTPNGTLTDSTNNVLSHELVEAITDPDGDAWWNSADNGLFGEEIGDECSFLAFTPTGAFLGFDPSIIKVQGKQYALQPEYDNSAHACTAKQ